MSPNVDPAIFNEPFSKSVCKTMWDIGRKSATMQDDPPPMDLDEMIMDSLDASGHPYDITTVRMYSDCIRAGYNGQSIDLKDDLGLGKDWDGIMELRPPFKRETCEKLRSAGKEAASRWVGSCNDSRKTTFVRELIGMDPKLDEQVLRQYADCMCDGVDAENSRGLWIALGFVGVAALGVFAITKIK